MKYYAHSKTGQPVKDWQLLVDHLNNVAELAADFAGIWGCKNTAFFIGLLHDFGKYTQAFQNYLERSSQGEKVTRGEVIHALQGTKFSADTIKDPLIADIIGNVIATHHGGLFDNITDGESTLSVKISKSEDKLHYEEAIKAFEPNINVADLKTEILNFYKASRTKGLNGRFMLHFMTKVLYSCLVDADRCDTAGIKTHGTLPDWTELIKQLENYLEKFSNKNAIDSIRKRISEQCRCAGKQQPGIYTLSVPTGGGKTLSSLRFALEHAREHKLKRIIYIIPYLSILDQTAAKLHEIFTDSDKLILEHHSNIEPPDDDDDENQYHLLTSRWDSPIILTTMVQFLETIYSNKASKLRKFHNMSEAVLIFDEIQSLPIKCIHLFNDAANFLQIFGQSTILLCTATQPHLHKTERSILLSDKPDIVSIATNELKIFERVRIQDMTQSPMNHEQIVKLIKAQIEQAKNTLVIFNTKSSAKKIYEQCKTLECGKVFLTTNLCPAHRLDILAHLQKNLAAKPKRPILCISTQLIEAGVDISFDCVIRAEAGMDSIIQAAGRCNRNKENPTPQSVFVVDVKDEKLSRLPEIKDGKETTARVFREKQGTNLLSDEVISLFYKYYFYANKNKMDYNTKDGKTTIYSLLNDNPFGIKAYEGRNNAIYKGLPCAFQTASDEFSVIGGAQTGIVVPYGNALELVETFQHCYDPKEKMRILRQLQKYTVSVYSNILNELVRTERAVENIDDTFYLLSPDYYDSEEQGLKYKAMFSLLEI